MAFGAGQEIADRRYEFGVATAARHGRTFKQSAAGGLRERTGAAAEEIIDPRRFGSRSQEAQALDQSAREERARQAVESLVDRMASHAATIRGYAPDRLGERTLAYAMHSSGFCPCRPIC